MSAQAANHLAKVGKGRSLTLILALALSAGLLWLAVRGVYWTDLLAQFARASLSALAGAAMLYVAAMLLRGQRWRVLLASDRQSVAYAPVFWSMMFGYLGNHYLPARAGDLMRSAVIGSRAGLSRSFALATTLVERIMDAAVLVAVSVAMFLYLGDVPAWMQASAVTVIAISLGAVLAIFVAPGFERHFLRLVERLPLRTSRRERLAHFIERFFTGLRSLRSVRNAVIFLILTGLIWLGEAFFAMTVASSLGHALSLPQALLLLAALGLSSCVPSTPGYLGVYQYVAVTVLAPFSFARIDALALIIVFQALQYAVITPLGLAGIVKLGSAIGSGLGLRGGFAVFSRPVNDTDIETEEE